VTVGELQALRDVARALGRPPDELAALIDFETAGTWNPQLKNPGSSARGLIQFMDLTAREMGYNGSADLVARFPTVEAQLRGPVLSYLSRYMPYPSLQALAMAVFYPAARYWDPEMSFPAVVQLANPGIRTVQDYVDQLERRLGSWSWLVGGALDAGAAVPWQLIAGVVVFFVLAWFLI